MKKRKLKGFVLPTLYVMFTFTVLILLIMFGSNIELGEKSYNYSTNILRDNTESVISEDEDKVTDIISPIEDEEAEIAVHFYSSKDNEEAQKNSLILYENTYLPNTGLLYASDIEFVVKTIYEGKVTEVYDDEFFGNVLVVEHTNTLKSYYYGLEDIEVSVGDEITNNTILGVSRNNEVLNNKKTFLLEVYYNNELVNPEKIIGTKITDY